MPIMGPNIHDEIANTGLDVIYGGHAAGIYLLPDEFTKPYGELVKDFNSPNARKLWDQACRAMPYRGAELITDYLRPAFDKHLRQFSDDIAALGHFADLHQPTVELLAAGDQIREAYLRTQQAHAWYLPIRAAWRAARWRDVSAADCPDPRGLDSALAEFRNVADVVEQWRTIGTHTGRGYVTVPWEQHGSAPHLRLRWAIRNGLTPWIPTAAEHAEAWHKYNPARQHGINPAMVSHTTSRS